MNEKLRQFYEDSKALITYLLEEHVFDKMADCGCGGVDAYRSERFDELIRKAAKSLGEFEREMSPPGP
ncbi:MAG TPA: hypothetical protein PLM79_05090 [Syntrophobacteraceae bacterium]|nr:hypothetical protein [Syntrophobacteraceae bacterium]